MATNEPNIYLLQCSQCVLVSTSHHDTNTVEWLPVSWWPVNVTQWIISDHVTVVSTSCVTSWTEPLSQLVCILKRLTSKPVLQCSQWSVSTLMILSWVMQHNMNSLLRYSAQFIKTKRHVLSTNNCELFPCAYTWLSRDAWDANIKLLLSTVKLYHSLSSYCPVIMHYLCISTSTYLHKWTQYHIASCTYLVSQFRLVIHCMVSRVSDGVLEILTASYLQQPIFTAHFPNLSH